MKPFFLYVLSLSLPGVAGPSWSKTGFAFEFLTGSALNLRSPLCISQAGYADIRLSADYRTRPFQFPIFWDIRASRRCGKGSWEIELIHHKLFLENPTPEIQSFSVSHGLNILTINHAQAVRGFSVRAGAGVVVAHPETTVRGRTHPQNGGLFHLGYLPSGLSILLGAGRRFDVWRGWFAVVEAKYTAARARIPVEQGHARLTNLALHGEIGFGYGF